MNHQSYISIAVFEVEVLRKRQKAAASYIPWADLSEDTTGTHW